MINIIILTQLSVAYAPFTLVTNGYNLAPLLSAVVLARIKRRFYDVCDSQASAARKERGTTIKTRL